MINDIDLISSAIKGDATAFSALLERHYDLIFRLTLRTLANRQDAEDVTQDICVALAKKLHSFQSKAKFTTWLYQVTLNACRDFQRRTASANKTQAAYQDISEQRDDNARQRQQEAQWAYDAINTLDDPLRETALFVVAEGLNHSQVGDILNVKESTISWRMLKVREQLSALAKTEANE